jgi:hypothetical protein
MYFFYESKQTLDAEFSNRNNTEYVIHDEESAWYNRISIRFLGPSLQNNRAGWSKIQTGERNMKQILQ